MAEEKTEKVYPVKSLHDFLFELDKEWSKFRNGTLISLISSVVFFIVVIFVILGMRRFHLGPFDFVLLVFAGVLLGYSMYAMYSQYLFFSRWERRVGLLLHLEEELIAGKFDETAP